MSGSRTFWTRLAAFALAGVLLGVLASFLVRGRGDPGLDQADAPTSSATLALPVPTSDRPTGAQATPSSATLAPTARPTDAATSRPKTSLAAFTRHVSAAMKDGGALLQSLRDAAEAFDIATVRSDAATLAAWAGAESDWLDAHPPRACYAKVHSTYGSAIDDFAQAASITEQFAADFPFADFDSLQPALDLAQSGATSMQSAVDMLPVVRC